MPQRVHKTKIDRRRRVGGGFRSWFAAILFGVALAAAGGGYLVTISSASMKGDQIRTLENEVAALKEEQDRLELKVAQEQSVRAVDRKVQELGMVPTPKVEYVMATVPTVAMK